MAENRFRSHFSNNGLLQKKIGRAVLSLAMPLIAAGSLSIFLELTDAFFVGRLGSEALAAVALAGVVIFLLSTIGMGLGVGTTALVARAFGEQDYLRADRVVVQSLFLGIFFSLAIGIVGYLFSPYLLRILGAQDTVLKMATAYLRILFAGIFTMYWTFLGSSAFQGAGDTLTPMKINGLSVILNIILDPLLIFGWLGFPRLEVVGAAIATVFSRTIGSLLLLVLLYRGRDALQIKGVGLRLERRTMATIIRIGFPSSIQMVLRSFSATVLVKVAALFGSVVLAAYGVGGRIYSLFLLPGFGFGGAAATLMGQNLGADNSGKAEKSAWTAVRYYLFFLIFCGLVISLFATPIARVFNPNVQFVAIAVTYFRYMSAGALFLSTGVVLSRALQGVGDTVSPMMVTAISLYLIQIPLAYFLALRTPMRETGLWLATALGNFISGLLMFSIFIQGKWKERKL